LPTLGQPRYGREHLFEGLGENPEMERLRVRKTAFTTAEQITCLPPATKAAPKERLPVPDTPLIQFGVPNRITITRCGIQKAVWQRENYCSAVSRISRTKGNDRKTMQTL
jgi:hypothetical protein